MSIDNPDPFNPNGDPTYVKHLINQIAVLTTEVKTANSKVKTLSIFCVLFVLILLITIGNNLYLIEEIREFKKTEQAICEDKIMEIIDDYENSNS